MRQNIKNKKYQGDIFQEVFAFLQKKGLPQTQVRQFIVLLCDKAIRLQTAQERFWALFCLRVWIVVLISLALRISLDKEEMHEEWLLGGLFAFALACLIFRKNFPSCWWHKNGILTPEGLAYLSWVSGMALPQRESSLWNILQKGKKTGLSQVDDFYNEFSYLLEEKEDEELRKLDQWTMGYSLLEMGVLGSMGTLILWEPIAKWHQMI